MTAPASLATVSTLTRVLTGAGVGEAAWRPCIPRHTRQQGRGSGTPAGGGAAGVPGAVGALSHDVRHLSNAQDVRGEGRDVSS